MSEWWNGRHASLRCLCPRYGCAGSNPASDTIANQKAAAGPPSFVWACSCLPILYSSYSGRRPLSCLRKHRLIACGDTVLHLLRIRSAFEKEHPAGIVYSCLSQERPMGQMSEKPVLPGSPSIQICKKMCLELTACSAGPCFLFFGSYTRERTALGFSHRSGFQSAA